MCDTRGEGRELTATVRTEGAVGAARKARTVRRLAQQK